MQTGAGGGDDFSMLIKGVMVKKKNRGIAEIVELHKSCSNPREFFFEELQCVLGHIVGLVHFP
jgi:hypothetical protein